MQLTPYQQEKFKHLESSIKDGIWYTINPDRPDHDEFIACLKLYADIWDNIEINSTWTAFRRFYPVKTLLWLSENSTYQYMEDLKKLVL